MPRVPRVACRFVALIAIFAAIAMLARSVGIELADIQRVYLAGGFGNFLNVPNAIALGMLPDVPADRVSFVGNTAIAGARAALCSRTVFERVRKAAASMTYVDLMTNPKYMEEFVSANFIPHTDLDLFPSVAGHEPARST